jgi:hypothetical protein
MSAEENKALVRRLYAEVWNTGNLDVADGLCAVDRCRPLCSRRITSRWWPGTTDRLALSLHLTYGRSAPDKAGTVSPLRVCPARSDSATCLVRTPTDASIRPAQARWLCTSIHGLPALVQHDLMTKPGLCRDRASG